MKKLVLVSVGMFALVLLNASGQVLMTTVNDFRTNYNDWVGSITPSTAWDYDGSTINGLGNPDNAAGGAGTAGSLELNYGGGGGWGVYGQLVRAGNPDFLHTIDPGSWAAYSAESGFGPGKLTAQSGVLKLVYTLPDNGGGGGGTYFQVGLGFNHDGFWNPFWDTGSTYLGNIGGLETYEATIPYTVQATASLTYFNLMVFHNTDYVPLFPWYVDDIRVASVTPEPSTVTLMGLGFLALVSRARRRS